MTTERARDATATRGASSAPERHWLNEERVRVYSWMVVAIFGSVFVGWLALSLPDLVDPRGKPLGYDFMAFWSAAKLALAGRPESAFDEGVISAVQHAAVPFLPGIIFPWHYPPTFLLPVVPLGLLPYAAALVLFALGTAAVWAGLVRLILPDRRAWIVAAAAPAGLINLLDGQNAFLTASLAGFALLWLDRRPIAAGVLIGLLAIKPHLAVLFPLALLAEGRWRTIIAAAVTVLTLAAASVVAFGWDSWAAFLQHLPITQAMAERGAVPWGTMPSGYVFALSLGAPVKAAWVLQAMTALFAAGCVWCAWRNPAAPFEAKAATLVAGSLLVSPYLFYYDLVWAVLAIGWLAVLGLRSGFRRGEREVFLFAFLAPALMPPVQMLTAVQLGFPAVLLLVVAAVRRAAPPSEAERRYFRDVVDLVRSAGWLTGERVMRWGVGFAILAAALVVVHIVTHTRAGLTDASGDQLGTDFINYWSGAQLAATGQTALAYDHRWFYAFEQAVTGPGSDFKLYGYPPIAMLLSLPLALFSFVPALIVWTVAGAALCFALLRRLVGWQAAAIASVGAPAAFLNLLNGQNGYFTGALLAGGLMLLERHPVLAGICIGVLAYKPQLAMLLPVALAAGGRWRAFGAAAVTVAVLGLATLLLFGTVTWGAFLDQMTLQRRMLEVGTSFWHRMPSVFAAARVLGVAVPAAYAAQILSSVLCVVAVALVWRRPGPFEIKAATLAVATFLATPYAWDYDMVVLVFAAAWLAGEGLRTGFRPWERIALVALLVAPLLTMVTTKLIGIQPGPLVLGWVLLLLLRRSYEFTVIPSAARAGVPARRDSLVA